MTQTTARQQSSEQTISRFVNLDRVGFDETSPYSYTSLRGEIAERSINQIQKGVYK